jgi:large subunit ribosomal protein L32e
MAAGLFSKPAKKSNKMEKRKLLELRKIMKARKPDFIRQDSHKKAEIKTRWIKPRGKQSKMRLHLKGYRKSPSKGYRSPGIVRGLHPSGYISVMASSKKDLEKVDAKSQGAIIAKSVGMKKKVQLVNYAKEKGITILNIKDPDKFLADTDKKLKEKKKEKEERKKGKEEKAKKKEKARPKKEEKLAEKLTEEEKKEQEKKEQDKLLTKKEA